MRSFSKWLSGGIAGVVAAALFQRPISKILDWVGYNDAVDKVIDSPEVTLNFLEQIVGVAAFPWIAGAGFGFFAGVWLDWILRGFEAKPDKHKPLASRSYSLSKRIKMTIKRSFPDEGQLNNIRSESVSLLIEFKKLGYKIPLFNSGIHTAKNLKIFSSYFDLLYSFMRNGQISEAKKIASAFVKQLSG